MRHALIMAGGSGTRLWPLSRADRPKQLLRLFTAGDASRPRCLLELAAARLEGLIPPERRAVCTAERYRDAILRALPGLTDEQILGEPEGRDTLNAVGFGAAVFSKTDRDAVMLVLTADHLIEPDAVFRDCVELGFRLVEADPTRLLTFSITPTYPATGYGYVERGSAIHGVPGCVDARGNPRAFRVARFVEKPNRHVAEAYVRSGSFGWNSGMFIFHAGTFLQCLEWFKPESHAGLLAVREAWGTPAQRETLERVYPGLPRISVDFAVMEPASRDRRVSIVTVPMGVSWMDVGSWPSFADTLKPDADGNRVCGSGSTLIVAGKNNLVVQDDEPGAAAPGHTVALLGVDDMVVVRTPDATLVMPRARAEELKELHKRLDDRLK